MPNGQASELPARVPDGYARADTFDFGYYEILGGEAYAVAGETWTFDHGAPDPLEGWYSVDISLTSDAFFRRITQADWSGHGNEVVAPIIAGEASAWVGIHEDQADSLCWDAGLGYGNKWCQRWTSPELTYSGTGMVLLSFQYFNDTEEDFDYTKVLLRFPDGTDTSLNGDGFEDRIGDPAIGSYATFAAELSEGVFGAQTQFRLVFEMTAGDGWSDEDGLYSTAYGPFGVDEIGLTGSLVEGNQLWDFEDGSEGFVASFCPPFLGADDLSSYTIGDPCACRLSGKVMELHNDDREHPNGQWEMAISPIADLTPVGSSNQILADWDQYSELPYSNGVFFRPGWSYYPYVCPQTGVVGWSGRQGQTTYNLVGEDAVCQSLRNVATDFGIPKDAEQVRFIYEIIASCDAFQIPDCTGESNFTPLLDNLRIRATAPVGSPPIAFEPGMAYQDGFGQGLALSTTDPGNADVTFDLHRDNPTPDKLGDSLVVFGPVPSNATRWDARLWWRIRREGPGASAIAGYGAWKTAIADGLSIVGPDGQFTFGLMDSVQVGLSVQRHRYLSEFREDDDDFAGENTNNNEMIRDGILPPGTKVEYFLTSNYTCDPDDPFYLPDTTGGSYLEFEILPSYRLEAGIPKFPFYLFVDLDTGVQPYVQAALNLVMNGAAPSDPIPEPTRWDRYDYQGAGTGFNAPLARSIGGNNGCTILQLLGYRAILLDTGLMGPGALETADFTLFGDWLSSVIQNGNVNRQGFLASGDDLSSLLVPTHPGFLADYLGAAHDCDTYSEEGCGPAPADEQSCVQIESAPGSLFDPVLDYDAHGNACPQAYAFDVLGTTSGVGNRVYAVAGSDPPVSTEYAQVVKAVDVQGNSPYYRSVLNGMSWAHLSQRSQSGECGSDFDRIVSAISGDILASLCWIFEGAPPGLPSCATTGVEREAPILANPLVNRLHSGRPNPFLGGTAIKFTLAAQGRIELLVYDAAGRKLRSLAEGVRSAGEHELIWDGTDDRGLRVGSGIYWGRLRAGDFTSSMKMIVLE